MAEESKNTCSMVFLCFGTSKRVKVNYYAKKEKEKKSWMNLAFRSFIAQVKANINQSQPNPNHRV